MKSWHEKMWIELKSDLIGARSEQIGTQSIAIYLISTQYQLKMVEFSTNVLEHWFDVPEH